MNRYPSRFVKLDKIKRNAYILNVYDSLSFDIDIFFDEKDAELISNNTVLSSDYEYLNENGELRNGKSYRFRLFGLKCNNSEMHDAIRTLFYRHPLVEIEILAIDVYSRFLGNINCNSIGDLGEYLQINYPEIFEMY